jgi:hypothetical protein
MERHNLTKIFVQKLFDSIIVQKLGSNLNTNKQKASIKELMLILFVFHDKVLKKSTIWRCMNLVNKTSGANDIHI